MNETITSMIERRSCRSFTNKPVERELIEQVIEAGLYAASGKGAQAPIVVAVTNSVLRDKLSEANREIGGWKEGFDPFYGAPVVLVVLANTEVPTYVYDGSLALGNMMLAAHSLGLASIWIHRAKQEFEQGEWKSLLAELGVEGDFEGIGHCCLGYTDDALPAPPARKDGRVFWVE